MDYKKIYNSIIDRGRTRIFEGYTESHHIIPRCIGGSDDLDNLVNLTPEEHYIAHQLLVKMYPDNHKLAKAATMMTVNRPTNKIYGWLRRRHAIAMSDSQSGKGNSQYGTRWIHNNTIKESTKINNNDPLPEGWVEGRKFNWNVTAKCEHCGNEFEPVGLEKFCSTKCKTYYRSPQYEIIDNNIESILLRLKEIGSISAVLREFGIVGNKIGVTYVSKIAKKRGINILRRRNSPV